MAAELSPMVIPPRPWCQVNEGGYFINPGVCVCVFTPLLCSVALPYLPSPLPSLLPPSSPSLLFPSLFLPLSPVSIMRTIADVYQHHSLLQQAPNLNAVFDSLNVLGTSPWRINTRVYLYNTHTLCYVHGCIICAS